MKVAEFSFQCFTFGIPALQLCLGQAEQNCLHIQLFVLRGTADHYLA